MCMQVHLRTHASINTRCRHGVSSCAASSPFVLSQALIWDSSFCQNFLTSEPLELTHLSDCWGDGCAAPCPAFPRVLGTQGRCLHSKCFSHCAISLAQNHIFNSWKIFVRNWSYCFSFFSCSCFSRSPRDPSRTLYILDKCSITELHS